MMSDLAQERARCYGDRVKNLAISCNGGPARDITLYRGLGKLIFWRRGAEVRLASVPEWFMEEVQSEQARLRSSIRALGVRAEAIDDIAQEALVIALTKLDEFDRGGDFGAWVRQIARRLVANERRKEARRNLILSDEVTDLLLDLQLEPATMG